MKAINEILTRRQAGAVRARLLAAVAGLVVVVAVAVYFFWPVSPPEVTAPPASAPRPPATAEERGDSARELIADLKSAGGSIDYAQAYARAGQFRAAGRLADAQLLYFFAARGKHPAAAVELAAMYDPVRFDREASLMDEPDPFQAYKWYRQALEAGEQEAGERLAALKTWTQRAAETGDTAAERLLLQWEEEQ